MPVHLKEKPEGMKHAETPEVKIVKPKKDEVEEERPVPEPSSVVTKGVQGESPTDREKDVVSGSDTSRPSNDKSSTSTTPSGTSKPKRKITMPWEIGK